MDLLQRLTEAIAPPADDPAPTCSAPCNVHYLGARLPVPDALPPDRLLPSEVAALRLAMTSCPILRRIAESQAG